MLIDGAVAHGGETELDCGGGVEAILRPLVTLSMLSLPLLFVVSMLALAVIGSVLVLLDKSAFCIKKAIVSTSYQLNIGKDTCHISFKTF